MKTTKIGLYASMAALFAACQSEPRYVKEVTFEPNTPLEQKLEMAAHVVPSPQQLNWQKLEMTAFVHFTINTFTDMEWGHGDEDPQIFNPTELDARQWAKTLSEAGMKMVILTAKHHDGFCLWPTKTTKHSVVSAPWKDGKGDIVKELREACDEFGLKFGVYLSPWDRNAPSYGDSEAYNKMFNEQLTELLTWYGKVDEVWFDGANGEGPNGKKQIYDWDSYYKTIQKLQPEAVIAIMGEDVRWVGTESGYGRETEWSVTALAPGGKEEMQAINKTLDLKSKAKDLGSEQIIEKADKLFWYPAEVDVSIRPGWFYHKHQDDKVKSLTKMVDIYFNSVGMNSVLLLNIPPDTRGLIHENDVQRLQELSAYLKETFQTDFLKGAKVIESIAGTKAVDDQYDTYWKVGAAPASTTFEMAEAQEFNVVMLQENIANGQRVSQFKVEALVDGNWKEIGKGTTIGYKRLLRFDNVKASQVRITIEAARANAEINTISLFKAPEILSSPVIDRNKEGIVSLKAETTHPVITYTLDGSEPTATSTLYTAPFALPKGGIVKARTFINNFTEQSEVVSAKLDICPSKWTVVSASRPAPKLGAENAIDGTPTTIFLTPKGQNADKHPHHIAVDLGETLQLKGFTYSPRVDHYTDGTIFKYKFSVSTDGKNWKEVNTKGEFSNIANNPVLQEVFFKRAETARFIKFESIEGAYNQYWVSIGELGIITR